MDSIASNHLVNNRMFKKKVEDIENSEYSQKLRAGK
jgi:hypothetical protein